MTAFSKVSFIWSGGGGRERCLWGKGGLLLKGSRQAFGNHALLRHRGIYYGGNTSILDLESSYRHFIEVPRTAAVSLLVHSFSAARLRPVLDCKGMDQ